MTDKTGFTPKPLRQFFLLAKINEIYDWKEFTIEDLIDQMKPYENYRERVIRLDLSELVKHNLVSKNDFDWYQVSDHLKPK